MFCVSQQQQLAGSSQVPLLTLTLGGVRAAAGEAAGPREAQVRAAAIVGAVVIG